MCCLLKISSFWIMFLEELRALDFCQTLKPNVGKIRLPGLEMVKTINKYSVSKVKKPHTLMEWTRIQIHPSLLRWF